MDQIDRIERKLDKLLAFASRSFIQEAVMTQQLQNLTDNVAAQDTVIASAVTLLGELKTALDAAIASGDMTQVQAIADHIAANNTALANAVVANTPAAPAS